ncbi:chaperone NapD [uncultured Alsobacter sp.]|uniref:chaperone NapD n=1 Tax=uncultured Alsobacter sp. TaxID=1748258 RepID=UPI0025D4B891|nr:chaperone NapD [uncultured Alsobacter sp.]
MHQVNVCGLVVHVAPTAADRVRGKLAAFSGLDLHASDGDRLVVTVMDTPTTQALEQIAAINRIPGVVSTSLAYHQVEEITPSCGCGSSAPDASHDCLARP